MRLFVGVYPPRSCAQSMLDELKRLDLPPFRAVPIEQVHLTVHFVGPVRTGEVDQVAKSMAHAASGIGPFQLKPIQLLALPPRGPRLIACETTLPSQLAELQRRLVTRLASKPSDREYLPHITLCRFRSAGPRRCEPSALSLEPFAVGEVCLMRSVLLPEGAEHRLVGAISLEGEK